jgi:hypothetical protein
MEDDAVRKQFLRVKHIYLVWSAPGFGLVHFLFLLILVHCVTSQLIFFGVVWFGTFPVLTNPPALGNITADFLVYIILFCGFSAGIILRPF